MENYGLITTKNVQKVISRINSIIHLKKNRVKMDENHFLPNLGIIQALLQPLNEIFQNTKISTTIYSN